MAFKSKSTGYKRYYQRSFLLLIGLLIALKLFRQNSLRTTKFNEISKAGYPNLEKFLIAQSKFETANYTSNIFRENNNLFGMKLPKSRSTTATGENRGHATFKNTRDSVIDMTKWLNMYRSQAQRITTLSEYVTFLKSKRYFEDSITNYLNGLTRWL